MRTSAIDESDCGPGVVDEQILAGAVNLAHQTPLAVAIGDADAQSGLH